jgi:hypothetical protein
MRRSTAPLARSVLQALIQIKRLLSPWPIGRRCSMHHASCPKARSAPADAIHRTATIHRRSRPYRLSRRSSRDRPWAQHDARSSDATGRITDILAVNDGASLFRTCGYEASYQQRRRKCDREFHFGLPMSEFLTIPWSDLHFDAAFSKPIQTADAKLTAGPAAALIQIKVSR